MLCETSHDETVGIIDGVISYLFMSWFIFTTCFSYSLILILFLLYFLKANSVPWGPPSFSRAFLCLWRMSNITGWGWEAGAEFAFKKYIKTPGIRAVAMPLLMPNLNLAIIFFSVA